MSTQHRTTKSVYLTLAAGAALGAIALAGVERGMGVTPAVAQGTDSVSGGYAPRVIGNSTAESLAELHNLDSSLANLASFASPAVVHITAVTERKMGPSGERMPVKGGEGSGFIFRPDGYIITNDHVVGGYDKVTVILKDGRELPGKVIRAEDSDIAIVKVSADSLPTLAFADSTKVRPGQISMAIGAPFGLEQSVTIGHVSALSRETVIQGKQYPDLIQTDTPINMGNSGGPLVNVDGQVIGINTAIYSPTGINAGIGFSIPANQARLIADILIKDGKLTRSMLKLVPENLKDYQKKEMGLSGGALVTRVESDGPAAMAGIKQDDVIVRIGDTTINSQLDLRNAMLVYRPGTTVPIEVVRNKQHVTLQVKLIAYEQPKATITMPDGNGSAPQLKTPKDLQEWFKDMPGFPKIEDDSNTDDSDVPAVRDGRARLGVSVQTLGDQTRKSVGIPSTVSGAYVADVTPGSVAARLGLQPGDVITQLGDKKIQTAEDLTSAMSKVNWGDKKKVSYKRFKSGLRMEVTHDVTFR